MVVTNVVSIYLTLQLAVFIRKSKSAYITYMWENSFNHQPSIIYFVCVNVHSRTQDLKWYVAEMFHNEIYIGYSGLAGAESKKCTDFERTNWDLRGIKITNFSDLAGALACCRVPPLGMCVFLLSPWIFLESKLILACELIRLYMNKKCVTTDYMVEWRVLTSYIKMIFL